MPLVSVIVPVYNGQEFIKKCYQTICEQTFQDFEIIFVNDGSTDDSLKILNEIKETDERVVVINQENNKQGAARNNGIRNAKGKYISFVDVDDFLSKDFLESLCKISENYNCEISMCSVTRFKPPHKLRELLKYDKEEFILDAERKIRIAYGNGTGRGVWNKLFRRDFLCNNDFKFREGVFYEDSDFTSRCLQKANSVAITPFGTYYYYVNPKSTMRSKLNSKKQYDKYIGAKITLLFELKNGINAGHNIVHKYDYRYFGINFLRIKETVFLDYSIEKYYLFDFLKIFQRKVKNELVFE